MPRITLTPAQRALVLAPPLTSAGCPGLAAPGGGQLKSRPEDFVVTEELAYAPDGRGDAHLLFTLRKRGVDTQHAIARLAEHCGIPQPEFGVAGLKDRHAVTTQWVSAPHHALAALARFSHPDIELGTPEPHGNKIRRGHAKANHFSVVVRGIVEDWAQRFEAKRERLAGGYNNVYGRQRFGHEGNNIEAGLAWLGAGGRGSRRLPSVVRNAGQSALFNLYVSRRQDRLAATSAEPAFDPGPMARRMIDGDVLKTAKGGLFVSEDYALDAPRVAAGEIWPTGPIFGGKMRWPRSESASEALECAVLDEVGLSRDRLHRAGKRLPGSRRPVALAWPAPKLQFVPAEGSLAAGLRVDFALPSGAYATVLLRELLES